MGTALVAFASAHNSVLNNQDLLSQVFKHLDDDLESESTRKKQVLWVGLTCRTFLDPALDVVWRSMDSFMPLLRVLPSFHKPSGSSSYVLREAKAEHWVRYEYYARRVRKMVYDPEEDGEYRTIERHTFTRLAQLLPGSLLPSLRHYHAPNVAAGDLFIHFLFLCPFLEQLELENCSADTSSAVGTLLSAISEQQSLQRLIIWGQLSAATLTFIPQLTRISFLEIVGNGQFMDAALIEKLGMLEYLEDLILDLEGAPPIHPPSFPAKGGFHMLHSLYITGDLSTTQVILTYVLSPSVVSLTIAVPSGPVSENLVVDCKRIMGTLSRKWPTSLQCFKLDHEGSTHNGVLSMDSLQPLFLLPHIQSLEIKNYSLPVSQDDVSKIASTWPGLVTLKLPCDVRGERPDMPTIASLFSLARHCPQLETLHFPINVDAVIPREIVQEKSPNLRNLSITSSFHNTGVIDETSIMKSVYLVARHLDRLFPRVGTVSWTHHGTMGGFWLFTSKVIRILQETRAEALRDRK